MDGGRAYVIARAIPIGDATLPMWPPMDPKASKKKPVTRESPGQRAIRESTERRRTSSSSRSLRPSSAHATTTPGTSGRGRRGESWQERLNTLREYPPVSRILNMHDLPSASVPDALFTSPNRAPIAVGRQNSSTEKDSGTFVGRDEITSSHHSISSRRLTRSRPQSLARPISAPPSRQQDGPSSPHWREMLSGRVRNSDQKRCFPDKGPIAFSSPPRAAAFSTSLLLSPYLDSERKVFTASEATSPNLSRTSSLPASPISGQTRRSSFTHSPSRPTPPAPTPVEHVKGDAPQYDPQITADAVRYYLEGSHVVVCGRFALAHPRLYACLPRRAIIARDVAALECTLCDPHFLVRAIACEGIPTVRDLVRAAIALLGQMHPTAGLLPSANAAGGAFLDDAHGPGSIDSIAKLLKEVDEFLQEHGEFLNTSPHGLFRLASGGVGGFGERVAKCVSTAGRLARMARDDEQVEWEEWRDVYVAIAGLELDGCAACMAPEDGFDQALRRSREKAGGFCMLEGDPEVDVADGLVAHLELDLPLSDVLFGTEAAAARIEGEVLERMGRTSRVENVRRRGASLVCDRGVDPPPKGIELQGEEGEVILIDQRPAEWEVVTLFISSNEVDADVRHRLVQIGGLLTAVEVLCLGRHVELKWVDLEEAQDIQGGGVSALGTGTEYLLLLIPGGEGDQVQAEWQGSVLTVMVGRQGQGRLHDVVAEELWRMLLSRFPRTQAVARWSLRDSEEDEELAARLPPLLTPLQSQLDTIQRLTAFATAPSAPSSSSPNILRIHGPPGSGKTSILASLCANLASSASPPYIVYACLREGRGPGYLSAHLCSQLGVGSVSLSACMQRQATRTVIIVDGVDAAEEDILRAALAAAPNAPVRCITSSHSRCHGSIAVPPLGKREAMQLATHLGKALASMSGGTPMPVGMEGTPMSMAGGTPMSLGRTPEGGGVNADVPNAIVAHASSPGGLTPRRMMVAVHCAALVGSAVRRGGGDDVSVAAAEHQMLSSSSGSSLEALYEDHLLAVLERLHGKELVKRSLAHLLSEPGGIPPHKLSEMLSVGASEEQQVMTKHALALVSDLLPFLDARGRSGVVQAACPSLGRAFELRYGQGVRLSPKERREAVGRYRAALALMEEESELGRQQDEAMHQSLEEEKSSTASAGSPNFRKIAIYGRLQSRSTPWGRAASSGSLTDADDLASKMDEEEAKAEKSMRAYKEKGAREIALSQADCHAGSVCALASLGGAIVCSGGVDGIVKVWDLSGVCSESSEGGAGTARVIHEWLAHKGGVLCAASSGNRLYTGGADKVLRVWERGSDGQYAAASVLVGHRGSVCVVKISGGRLYTCCTDGFVKLWEATPGRLVASGDEQFRAAISSLVHIPSRSGAGRVILGVERHWRRTMNPLEVWRETLAGGKVDEFPSLGIQGIIQATSELEKSLVQLRANTRECNLQVVKLEKTSRLVAMAAATKELAKAKEEQAEAEAKLRGKRQAGKDANAAMYHTEDVCCMAFGKLDKKRVLWSGGIRDRVLAWDVDSGVCLGEMQGGVVGGDKGGFTRSLCTIGPFLYSIGGQGDTGGLVTTWDASTRKLLGRVEVGKALVCHAVVNKCLVVGDCHGGMHVLSRSVDS